MSDSDDSRRESVIRTHREIEDIIQTFRVDPHLTYQQLQAVPHEELAVLAAQVLSLASSRVVLARPQHQTDNSVDSVPELLPFSMSVSMIPSALATRSSPSVSTHHSPPVVLLGRSHRHTESPQRESPQRDPNTVDDHPLSTPLEVGGGVQNIAPASGGVATNPQLCASSTSVRPQFEMRWLPLRDIFFYQDYVCNQFMDGRTLLSTIEELRSGRNTPETLPPIECLGYRGRWYGMGNRRLSCFHFVFRNEPDRLIPVRALLVDDENPFYPQGDGVTVRLGGGMLVDGKVIFAMKHCSSW